MLYRFSLTASVLLVASQAFAEVAKKYEVIPLPTICDNTDPSRCGLVSYGYDINNSGVVVGYSSGPWVPDVDDIDDDGDTTEERLLFSAHAFRWENGVITDLLHLGKNESYAFAINSSGTIVGRGSKVTSVSGTNEVVQFRAFRTGPDDALLDLGVPSAVTALTSATDISDTGFVVGYAASQVVSGNTSYFTRGFIWSPESGEMTLIPALEANSDSVLRAVDSNASTAVGYSTKNGFRRAISVSFSNSAELIEIGDLGGDTSEANDIDASGRIVGGSLTAGNNTYEAFVYDPSVSPNMRGLGQLATNLRYSQANAINNNGLVVGAAQASTGATLLYHATIFDIGSDGGQLIDLNSRIECASDPSERWQLTEALAINDAGEVVGYGSQGTAIKGFLLRPTDATEVPQPCAGEPEFENQSGGGAVMPLGLVLSSLMIWMRRRKKHSA